MVGESKGAGYSPHHLQSCAEHDQGGHTGKCVGHIPLFWEGRCFMCAVGSFARTLVGS